MRRSADEPLFNSLMEQHHYLGYEQPVGEHLKYLVWANARPIACLAWSSAPRHLASRDHYIGWSAEARRRNIRFLAYNTRFLILPWVRVEHLASHILGRMAARISDDWQRIYGHPIYFLETFVDPERFRGTCYRAANWVLLGRTTGTRQAIQQLCAEPLHQGSARLSTDPEVSRLTRASYEEENSAPACGCECGRAGPHHRRCPERSAERSRQPEAQNGPARLAEHLLPHPKTEKTSAVFGDAETPSPGRSAGGGEPPSGHGRNGAAAYRGAKKVPITHAKLVAWRSLSGVRSWQRLCAERAEGAGADRRPGAAGGNRV